MNQSSNKIADRRSTSFIYNTYTCKYGVQSNKKLRTHNKEAFEENKTGIFYHTLWENQIIHSISIRIKKMIKCKKGNLVKGQRKSGWTDIKINIIIEFQNNQHLMKKRTCTKCLKSSWLMTPNKSWNSQLHCPTHNGKRAYCHYSDHPSVHALADSFGLDHYSKGSKIRCIVSWIQNTYENQMLRLRKRILSKTVLSCSLTFLYFRGMALVRIYWSVGCCNRRHDRKGFLYRSSRIDTETSETRWTNEPHYFVE